MQSYRNYFGMVAMIGKYGVSNKTGEILPVVKIAFYKAILLGIVGLFWHGAA